jgi:two-component system chemotaxis response regulator CheY
MAYRFDRLSVLIVEDTAPMKKLLVSVLTSLGVGNIYAAEDGAHGFDLFCRNRPDIVITDWLMDPSSGLELVEKIRTDKRSPNRMTPIIMMTGYSARPRIENARDLGVTEFLAKPFSAADLARRIAYVVDKPRDFVDSDEFFGPDRRRKKTEEYKGPKRREEDYS